MGRTNSETRQRRKLVVLEVRETVNRRVSVDGRRAIAEAVTYKCKGCNYPVPYPDSWCGECLCEEDGI
jgi:hypothetical protein